MVGATDTLCIAAEQHFELCFCILGAAPLWRLVPADSDGVEFEENALEPAERVPNLERPAKTDSDFEFGGEEVFLRYYGASGGSGSDEGFDGGVVVFRLGREVEDEVEDVFGVEGEGGCGEVETVQEGQCRCLARTLSAIGRWRMDGWDADCTLTLLGNLKWSDNCIHLTQ